MDTAFGDALGELRRQKGASLRTLAARTLSNRTDLSLIERGRKQPTPALAERLDEALDADGELARLAHPVALPPPTPGRPLGDAEARDARATMQHLVALDTLQGSQGLVPVAVRAFRAAADRLAIAGGTADARSAVADLGAAAAWITADATERDQSRAIGLEALALADMAGDTRMRRFLLSHMSMVSEHAGRYGDALAYAERILADEPDSPRVLAMVQIRRARALSGLGGHDAAGRAWDTAAHLLTATPSADDGLTYWIHDSEMAIHKAVLLSRAGDHDAVDWALRGVEGLPDGQGRDQVLFRAMLLFDAVAAGAWEQTPSIVEDLMRFAGDARTARVVEELAAAWRLVAAGAHVPPRVRDAVRAAYDAFRPHLSADTR